MRFTDPRPSPNPRADQPTAARYRQVPTSRALSSRLFEVARRLDRRAVDLDDDVALLYAKTAGERIGRDLEDDALDDVCRVGKQ